MTFTSSIARLWRRKPFWHVLWRGARIGTCSICEGRSLFFREGPNLREQSRCLRCDGIPRWRALVWVMGELRSDWRSTDIHESSASGPTLDMFRKRCPRYVPSHFFPSVPTGTIHDGFRCEDLGCQTFSDESFDFVVTQDVLEHLPDPVSGLREIARTLRPGGFHVFTIPRYRGIPSRIRARMRLDGTVEHIEPRQVHGNPIDPDGCLVFTDWGDDIAERIFEASGMFTTIFRLEDPGNGIEGGIEIFVSRKPRDLPKSLS